MVRRLKPYWKEKTYDSRMYYTVTYCPVCDVQRHCEWIVDDVEDRMCYVKSKDGMISGFYTVLIPNVWFVCSNCECTFGKVEDGWTLLDELVVE